MNPTDPIAPVGVEQLLVHARFLRGLVRGLVADDSSANDLSQETWLQALDRPPAHAGNLRGWFVRVSRRLAGAERRCAGRRRERELDSAQELTLPDPAETAARRDALQRVTRAVLALKEPYATTIQLRFYEGLEASEIAEQSGVPLATVRSRLQRALQQLREQLDAQYGGDREAWCLGLVSLVASKNLTEASAAGGGKLGLGVGALLMGTGVKIAVAALGLGLAGFVLWNTRGEQVSSDAGGSIEVGSGELAASARDDDDGGLLASPADLASSREAQDTLPASNRGELELQVTWARDGSPAADLELSLLLWAHAAGDRKRSGRTDAGGNFRLEDLQPGRVSVDTSFGSGGSFEVRGAETTRGVLEIAEGFSVRGRVVDREGTGVVGAHLWLSGGTNHLTGFIVAETGADGSYELHDVPRVRYLGALANGYAPSNLVRLGAGRSVRHVAADLEIELVLGDGGGGLQVQVVNRLGEPVSGALVHSVGARIKRPQGMSSFSTLELGAALDEWTDEFGWSELRGLKAGLATLKVYGASMAPWSGSANVIAGQLETLRVELEPECVVFGVLQGPASEPAEGAQVGIVGDYDPLMPLTVADDDGRYELRGLPAGEVQLKATHKELGSITTTLQLDPETATRWDPSLGVGRIIVGRVSDASGKPLAKWSVSAKLAQGGRWSASARSDAKGRFRILNCKAGALQLTLIPKSPPFRAPSMRREISADQVGEVLFVVGPNDLSDSSLRGQVVSADGEPLAGAHITPRMPGARSSSARTYPSDAQGRFLIEGMHAGAYQLTITPEQGPRFSLSKLSLVAHENHDAGVIHLPRAGLLILSVGGADVTGSGPYHYFHIDQVDATGAILSPGVARLSAAEIADPIELYPGDYMVKAFARGPFASERLAVTVEQSGSESRLEFHPRAGRSCDLGVSIAEGETLPEQVTIALFDEAGAFLRRMTARTAHERTFSVWEHLALGIYSFEVTLPDGRSLQHSFEVTPLAPDASSFEWDLKMIVPLPK